MIIPTFVLTIYFVFFSPKKNLQFFFTRLQEAQQMNAEMASTIDPIGLKPTSTSSMVVIYDVQNGDKRPANLVRSFGELYSVARLETLDDLDTIDELVDADELKNKLLFSVVVVSLKVYITLEYRVYLVWTEKNSWNHFWNVFLKNAIWMVHTQEIFANKG